MQHTYNSQYDDCQRNLENLALYYQNNIGKRNEATTRLHLINALLTDCLGWEKRDIACEEHQRKERDEFTDYTFFAPQRMMILEAKREGATFEIPDSKISITYTIKSICTGNNNLKAAIAQVANYCQSRGIPIAAISNGHQLLAFIANRNDGTPPMDGKAIVFPSLPDMLKYFPDFWGMLSRTAIEDKAIIRRLLGSHQPELPPRLATKLEYPGTKGRNVFQSELKHIAEAVIEDIPETSGSDREYLERCYCQSGALSQHSVTSKSILRARYHALFDETSPARPSVMPATSTRGIAPELYAESMSRRPILLLGDVGVGKSMFIRNFIAIAAEELLKDAITIRIDLGTSATLAIDLKSFIVAEIKGQLSRNYSINIDVANFVRGVYDIELREFRQSIYGELADSNPAVFKEKEIGLLDKHISNGSEHCRRSLEHLSKARKKQIVIFIDNADQRGDETQDEAFLISQEMAAKWPALVYIPLRPETFHRSVLEGALSGYHPKAFTIAPPRVDHVLTKRMQYALEIAERSIDRTTVVEGLNTYDAIQAIFKSFLHTLRREDYLVEFLDNICGGNIRTALKLTRDFFGSGHVDTRKIAVASQSNSYTVPLHEFLRAAIYGDYVYYHPDRSPFANMFDISSKDPKEHFLLPILLSTLRLAGHENKGFMHTSDIYSSLQGLGFTPDQVDFSIIRAYRTKLVETSASQRPDDESRTTRMIRATTVGLYHLDRLMSHFTYVDAMIVVTPILDDDCRTKIADVTTIADRLIRARLFQKYLDEQWKATGFKTLAFDWSAVSADLSRNITLAERASLPRHARHS